MFGRPSVLNERLVANLVPLRAERNESVPAMFCYFWITFTLNIIISQSPNHISFSIPKTHLISKYKILSIFFLFLSHLKQLINRAIKRKKSTNADSFLPLVMSISYPFFFNIILILRKRTAFRCKKSYFYNNVLPVPKIPLLLQV